MTRMNRMGFMFFVLMLAAGTAHADRFVSWQGGVFSPWNGHTGYSFAMQMGADFGDRSHWAFETEFRKFNGEIFSVRYVELKNVNLRGIYRYDVLEDWYVTPYLGVGGGIAINTYKKKKVKRALEERYSPEKVYVSGVGGGISILGLAGLEAQIPGTEYWRVFTEVRMEYNAQFSELDSNSNGSNGGLEVENLGGVSAQIGFRLSF